MSDANQALDFDPVHTSAIRRGEKTKTVRLETEIEPTGSTAFVDDSTGDVFGHAEIELVGHMSAFDAINDGWLEDGYENHDTVGSLLDSLRDYYPDADLGPETEIAMIQWRDFTEHYDYFADYPTHQR